MVDDQPACLRQYGRSVRDSIVPRQFVKGNPEESAAHGADSVTRADMADAPDTPLYPPFEAGRTDRTQLSPEKGNGRLFPCEQCGADLVFHIGVQHLKCEYCGHEQTIAATNTAEVVEHDYRARLAWLDEHKRDELPDHYEVQCSNCGATVVFQGTLTSSHCAYCQTPLQREAAHRSPERIAVDGLLPFLIEQRRAGNNLRAWVKSLWFAPNEFLRQGVEGRFQGVYLPFFTFDTLTFTVYSGQRGDHYTVVVGSGKDQRTETRTRWTPAAGKFQRFFDDTLVLAATGLNRNLMRSLEPWPLGKVRAFNESYLAGFSARTYDLELPACFDEARARIEAAIEAQVRSEIGGDTQSIDSMKVSWSAVTCKHILLPAWLLSYRYKGHVYQVFINATTGEVQGERPWSWVKILFAVLFFAAVVGGIIIATKS